MKIAIVSLGCPKNQVDADVFCRSLLEEGHETVGSIEQAQACIINTCGFIESAKEEAIENIFNAVRVKQEKEKDFYVIVTGCLSQRYKEELNTLIPEIDAVVGINDNYLLPQILRQLQQKKAKKLYFDCKTPFELGGRRIISTPMHYAWLKIAEGCSNACSYCAIPMIRGGFRSRDLKDCVQEAIWLSEQGVKEVVLVAQDVTAYGIDKSANKSESALPQLLKELDQINGIEWFRLLYTYPEKITEELVEIIKNSKKILPYFDMPIQHINDAILTSMGRKGGSDAVRNAINLVRRQIPNAVLRTSLIAGYPGESEEQFEELCEFVKEIKFDRLGCFAYSPEEGTRAEKFPGQLDEDVKNSRAETIMNIQATIMEEKQKAFVGRTIDVICDEFLTEENCWVCRSMQDAPEIDSNVFVTSNEKLKEGNIYKVLVNDSDVYDLYAEMC